VGKDRALAALFLAGLFYMPPEAAPYFFTGGMAPASLVGGTMFFIRM
jgi:hypothetical protein